MSRYQVYMGAVRLADEELPREVYPSKRDIQIARRAARNLAWNVARGYREATGLRWEEELPAWLQKVLEEGAPE